MLGVTPSGKVHTGYLPRMTHLPGFKSIYVGTKSNNPDKPKYISLAHDTLMDGAVILPANLRPSNQDVSSLEKKGFKVFNTSKKQDYPSLSKYLPDNAKDTDEFFIIKGPKVLPLLYGDEPYHGDNDDDAFAVISDTHGDVLTRLYLAMADGFNKEAQSFLVEQANTFPDEIFKKPHSARPLCETFTTKMDGLTEELEDQVTDCLVVLDLDLDRHKGLPPIPRRRLASIPDQITCAGNTSDDETESSAINKKRVVVLCNLSELTCQHSACTTLFHTYTTLIKLIAHTPVACTDDHAPRIPILEDEGVKILVIKNQKEYNEAYAARLTHLQSEWNKDETPLLSKSVSNIPLTH